MSNRANAIKKVEIVIHEKTKKLKVEDVYWIVNEKDFGKDNKIRLLPVNLEKSLIIETNIPNGTHEKKVNVTFLIPDSVLDDELSNITIDTYKDTITLPSGEKRYRFETKKIKQDLIDLV